MAKKITLARFMQEIQGSPWVKSRRTSPRPSAIFLMRMREQRAQLQQAYRRQTVAITTTWQSGPDVALPIRINHLDPGH